MKRARTSASTIRLGGFALCFVGLFFNVVTTTTPRASWLLSTCASATSLLLLAYSLRTAPNRRLATMIGAVLSLLVFLDDLSRTLR
jgi:hypothetical protein